MIQRVPVGHSSFPRKRESSGPKTSAVAPYSSQGQALDPRLRGGDDTLLITLASFQVGHSDVDFSIEALDPLTALLVDLPPVLEHEFPFEIGRILRQFVGDGTGHLDRCVG